MPTLTSSRSRKHLHILSLHLADEGRWVFLRVTREKVTVQTFTRCVSLYIGLFMYLESPICYLYPLLELRTLVRTRWNLPSWWYESWAWTCLQYKPSPPVVDQTLERPSPVAIGTRSILSAVDPTLW